MQIDTVRHGVKVVGADRTMHLSNVPLAADTALDIIRNSGSEATVVTPDGVVYSGRWEIGQLAARAIIDLRLRTPVGGGN